MIMRNHVEAAFKVLIEQEIVELEELSDSVNRIILIFLIVYIVILIIFYAAWLFQKANRLNTEVKGTLSFVEFLDQSYHQDAQHDPTERDHGNSEHTQLLDETCERRLRKKTILVIPSQG
jgi:flagellar basal body-associated protein FliL